MSSERFNMKETQMNKTDFHLLYLSTSKYEGEWQSLTHSHHFTELFYVVKGKGSFLVNQEQLTVREQDLVIVNPNIPHTEQSLDSQPLEYVVFGVEGLLFDFQSQDTKQQYGMFSSLPCKAMLPSLFQILLQEITKKQTDYELVCHNILEMILVFLSRTKGVQILPADVQKLTNECALIKRYLDLNYHQTITLDQLAQLAHTNKYYLAHSFCSYMGIPPLQYLIKRRLEAGKELLETTDLSMEQIASSTGFSSQSYFSQAFKKHTGFTPLQYRKSHHIKA